MQKGFKSISQIISGEKNFEEIRTVAKNFKIVEEFEKIFPDLVMVAKPVKAVKKVLYIKTENSVWRSELNLRQKLLIEKINDYFKEEVIKSIKFIS